MNANGATSYNVRRSTSSGGPYTNIASVTGTSYLDTTASANTAYYYVIQAIGATASANSYELSVGLPAGLLGSGPATTAEDIGATGGQDLTEYAANSSTPSASVYGLAGSGAGIWASADAFRYVSVPVSGNTTMTARVFFEQAPSAATQAGIDIRETLAPNATNAFVGISGGLGAEALVRSATGATTSVAALTPGISVPYWVRMSRVGNVFTSSISPDGKTWTVLSTSTLSMNTQAYIGLGSSSTTGALPAIALFDNVSVTGGYPPFD
jgi:regulation of enolase protein 1 (concanavalin A-like superfamily)